jgi:hypothetical protein
MFFLVGRNPDVPLTFFIRAHCNHQTLALYATQRAGEKHLTWLGCKLCLLEMSHQGIAYTWVDQVSVRILTINLSLCIIKKKYIYKYFEILRNMLKYQKPVTWNPQQSPISPEFNGTFFHQLEVGCNIFHTTFKDNFGSWRFVNQDVQVFQVPAGCFPAKHLMERTTPRHAVNQNTRLNYLMFWPLLHYLPTSLSNQFAGIKCNFVPNKETAHSFVSTNPNACRKLSGYCRPQQKLSRFVGKVTPSKLRVKCILGHVSSGFNHSLVPSQEVLGSGQTVCEIYIYILINPHHMILNRIPGLLGLIHPYWWCLKGISTGIGCQIWFVCSNSRNAWSVRTSCTPAEYASSIFVNLVVERNQLTKGDMSFSIPFMYRYPFLSNQKF